MPIRCAYTPYDVERTHKAIAYLDKNYREHISADQLAIEVSMDKRRLQTVMQVLTGLTIHHYLIKIRLDRATDDLNERFELTVEQIALRHGFPTSSWFIKHFKERMEQTPKEYRYNLLNRGKAL
ncbi:MAG TPA: AraC family transcriptional regulator [Puia sp.]|nr:AraC family transcriptional regulator [Puia sp.]